MLRTCVHVVLFWGPPIGDLVAKDADESQGVPPEIFAIRLRPRGGGVYGRDHRVRNITWGRKGVALL